MKTLSELKAIAANPHEYARRWKEKNHKKVIGSFCSYAPEEVILAADALPYRLFGSPAFLSLADAHLQTYSCSLVRGAMGEAMAGKLDFLDGVVFPHTCDSIQRLSDLWRLNIKTGFHTDVVLPVKLNTDSAGEYMYGVMKKFRTNLETEFDCAISDEHLRTAIDLLNRVRACFEKLYQLRADNPQALGGRDFHALIKAAMVMDRAALLESLTQIVTDLEQQPPSPGPAAKRLVLSGGICSVPDLYQLIEAAGGAVVGDDLCTGRRYFSGQIEATGEPLEAIARRYLQRAVCPAKHSDLHGRAENLVALVRKNKADGVVFAVLKFCDPHLFDVPYLKAALDKAEIPNLFFEIEDQTFSEGQLKTRCEAFIEMI